MNKPLARLQKPGAWKKVLVALLALAFSWFVWPTPYVRWQRQNTQYRENRFTGAVERRLFGAYPDMVWRRVGEP